jgi:tyrosine-protein kinase Etk/Wzc
MIQNNQATMQNVLVRRPQQAEDFIRLQDLMYLCLVRWRWFVISLVVTLGIATYYLLSTQQAITNELLDIVGGSVNN